MEIAEKRGTRSIPLLTELEYSVLHFLAYIITARFQTHFLERCFSILIQICLMLLPNDTTSSKSGLGSGLPIILRQANAPASVDPAQWRQCSSTGLSQFSKVTVFSYSLFVLVFWWKHFYHQLTQCKSYLFKIILLSQHMCWSNKISPLINKRLSI